MLRRIKKILIIAVFLGLVSACSGADPLTSSYYLVDPRFSELYENLQGKEVLGPPISNKKYLAGSKIEKQYFEGAVMVYDPDNSPRYYLEPVGREAGFSDLPDTLENNSAKYINGFLIPLEFSHFYDRMGGERWVGLPLTRARYNPEKNTIEQYFENMGFFRFANDPPGAVHLMPYGLWKCAGECSRYPGLENASIGSSVREEVPSPFGEAIARFGTRFTGNTVSGAYRAEDGTVEQIFQNVVLYQDSTNPLGVSLRPISSLLEKNSPSFEKRQDGSQGYFYEIQDGQGFYIPGYFRDFIDRYYGFGFSGEPISRALEIREGVLQQCFENYCLLFDAKADQADQVRLLPQGQKYKEAFQRSAAQVNEQPAIQRNIQLDIWEQLPQISSSESQQIGACVHESGTPLVNARARATVKIGSGERITLDLSPTDAGGCSFLKLDPIAAQNGTTIDYQVCFVGLGDKDYCQSDSFLIWGNSDQSLAIIPQESPPAPSQMESSLALDTWELQPQISSTESQEIGACVHQGDHPQVGLQAVIQVETKSEGVITYQGEPSDGGGCSFFKLEPIKAKNGETIPYQVCFSTKDGNKVCERDSFLIWGNP